MRQRLRVSEDSVAVTLHADRKTVRQKEGGQAETVGG
jgi:DNA-binding transcriptional regulator YiaG